MKKQTTLLLAVLIASLTVKSQLNFSVPIGVSTKKAPTIGTNIQYNFGAFFAGIGFHANISANSTKGALFYSKIGLSIPLSELSSLEIGGGYGTLYNSADKANANNSGILGSVYAVKKMERFPAALYAGVDASKSMSVACVGLRFIFVGKQKYGCSGANVK